MILDAGRHDLYAVLGVQPSASAAALRTSYRQAALHLHPDKGGAPESFHILTFAYEVLSCPLARAAYDKNRKELMQHRNRSMAHAEEDASAARSNATAARAKLDTSRATRTPPTHTPRDNYSQLPATTMGPKKQSAPSRGFRAQPSKRRRIAADIGPPRCCRGVANLQERMSRVGTPLSQLRALLQDMNPGQRQKAIRALAPRVQAALLLFMETFSTPPTISSVPVALLLPEPRVPKSSASAHSGIAKSVAATSNRDGWTYKAHVHIKALRFYTRGHAQFEVALERQIVLVQLRNALAAAAAEDPLLWEDAAETHRVCAAVLRANATSEKDLGLSAYMYMRAGHWLPQNCTIISPVMPLRELFALHCRFLRARRVSWQRFRAEWVQLMQCAQQPEAKRKTLPEAEAIANKARVSVLEVQFARAVGSVARALDDEERRGRARWRTQARRAARASDAAAAAERRAARRKDEACRKRRRWWRRADLTMEDILAGPPLKRTNAKI